MQRIIPYKIFENRNESISDYIEDILLEFTDENLFTVEIIEDESIHIAPLTNSVIFGNNFIFPSNQEKRLGKLPGLYNKDWKLGVLVRLNPTKKLYNPVDIVNLTYRLGQEASTRNNRRVKISRKTTVKNRKVVESEEKENKKKLEKVISFINTKIKMIASRAPSNIELFGVKIDDGQDSNYNKTSFILAFIHDAYK